METLTQIVFWLAGIYAAGVFAKSMLMFMTLPAATGTYKRLYERDGLTIHKGIIVVGLLVTVPIAALRWPFAFLSEGFGFFRIYSNRATMKDCVRGYYAAKSGL